MSNGFGFMLQQLFGGNPDSAAAHAAAKNKVIRAAWVMDGDSDESTGMALVFTDGTGILYYDSARSCCEYRYMTCDDDLAPFIGSTLMDVSLSEKNKEQETEETAEYGNVHELGFVDFKTSMGVFTATQHNEHNGYYGGICLSARALRPDEIPAVDQG